MRKILASEHIHEAIRPKIMGYQAEILDEVMTAVAQNRIVVVGMRYNNSVRKARNNLVKANLDFTYLEYGSYMQGWYKRLTLKMWTGFSTFPMVFIDQTLIGGNSELEALLRKGEI